MRITHDELMSGTPTKANGVHQYGHSLDGPAAGVHSGGAKFKILYAIIVSHGIFVMNRKAPVPQFNNRLRADGTLIVHDRPMLKNELPSSLGGQWVAANPADHIATSVHCPMNAVCIELRFLSTALLAEWRFLCSQVRWRHSLFFPALGTSKNRGGMNYGHGALSTTRNPSLVSRGGSTRENASLHPAINTGNDLPCPIISAHCASLPQYNTNGETAQVCELADWRAHKCYGPLQRHHVVNKSRLRGCPAGLRYIERERHIFCAFVCEGGNVGREADSKSARAFLLLKRCDLFGYDYVDEVVNGLLALFKVPPSDLRLAALLAVGEEEK